MRAVLLALPVVLALAGCNQTATGQAPAQQGGNSFVTPSTFKMPTGSGCSGDIARFKAIIGNDDQTGNVGDKVYNQMLEELKRPESLCAAGQEGPARAALASVKARHGYH